MHAFPCSLLPFYLPESLNVENVPHTKESFKENLANHGNLSALLCFIPIERLDPCLADIHFML